MTSCKTAKRSFVSTLAFAGAMALSLALAGPALADSSGSSTWSAPKKDADVAAAEKKIESGDYADAIPLLQKATQTNSRNADAFNLLAFSQRKSGDLENAAKNYQTALTIDPDHKGALGYQGELFLMLDQPERAQANLDRLDRLCFFGCDPYYLLKEAIAEYNAGNQGS